MVSIVHAARDIARLRDISSVLVRHGFGEVVTRLGIGRPRRSRPPPPGQSEPPIASEDDEVRGELARAERTTAERIRLALQDLGPSFVKLGQIASTRADVLPADVIAELKKLQDSVPPVAFSEIQAQVERQLGAPLGQLFESVDAEPLAAASVAQVHAARLKCGDEIREVVVKVQRPGIAETIASDVDILHALATLVERTLPETRVYSPVGLVRQFDRAVGDELDFSQEAENAARFAANFEGDQTVRFPLVYRDVSSKRVITLEHFRGDKIDAAVTAGHDAKLLARIALDAMVKQIFEHGFFHADPHPGNVFVLGTTESPCLGLIDLGMVGRLSPRMRDLTVDMMVSASRRDYDGIADALIAIGNPIKKIDMHAFRAEIALLAERYLGKALRDIQVSALIRDLVRTATTYGLEIPTDFLLVGKAMMTVEGVGKQIDPTLDVLQATQPFFFELLRQRYSPERIGLSVLRRLERLTGATSNLPEQLQEVLDDLRLGRMSIRTDDAHRLQASEHLGRRAFVGMVTAALLVGGSWLLAAQRTTVGTIMLAFAAVMLVNHVIAEAYRSFRRR